MIVDASVAVKWLIEEEGSSAAIDLIGRTELVAPALLHIEVANTIWKKARRGEFAHDQNLSTLPDQLRDLVRTEDELPVMTRALSLALSLDHPIYDCIYLALAEALETNLVTADTRFLRKIAGRYAGAEVKELGT